MASTASPLLYSDAVDTSLGLREVNVYWEDVAKLVFDPEHTMVVFSTTVYQGRSGKYSKSCSALQSELGWFDPREFQEVIRCAPGSYWSPVDPVAWDSEAQKGLPGWPPAILSSPLNETDSAQPRRYLMVRTLPNRKHDGAERMEDFLAMVPMVYAAFAAVNAGESAQNSTLEETNSAGAYKRILMSALGGNQDYDVGELIQRLVEQGKLWLRASPHLESVDIAYYEVLEDHSEDEKAQRQKAVRELILKEMGGKLGFHSKDAALFRQINETMKPVIDEALVAFDAVRGGKPHWHPGFFQALRDLRVVVERSTDPEQEYLISEYAVASGRLAESMVYALNRDLKLAPPKTFEKGIESLSRRASSNGNPRTFLSRWFSSYLHTLRILRNECAHAQGERGQQFPDGSLNEDDLEVLAMAVLRVLRLHREWRNRQWFKSEG